MPVTVFYRSRLILFQNDLIHIKTIQRGNGNRVMNHDGGRAVKTAVFMEDFTDGAPMDLSMKSYLDGTVSRRR